MTWVGIAMYFYFGASVPNDSYLLHSSDQWSVSYLFYFKKDIIYLGFIGFLGKKRSLSENVGAMKFELILLFA